MSEAYVECMVARKTSGLQNFFKFFLIAITVVFGLLALCGFTLALIVAVGAGVGAYFVTLYTDIEYEYLYLDKEITVDKVLHKTKRKRVIVFDANKIEIMAPLKSYHLDNFKNRTFKEMDLSSGVEQQPEVRYVFYYDGSKKVTFEPNEAMVKALRNIAPRKIFMD